MLRAPGLVVVLAGFLAGFLAGCDGAARTKPAPILATARDSVPVVAAPSRPIALDTTNRLVLEFWPLAIASGRQLEETRRIVEHLQADLTLVDGFERATLLASGDGSALLLVAEWRDDSAATRARSSLAGWLRIDSDTARQRRQFGTLTPRVAVRRTVGMPLVLGEAAMLLFTRYALKPGHSFGALASLTDSDLAMRVLQDTAAQGGATLASADSGALYMLLQARTATALDPALQVSGTLPFWAPFSAREEQHLAVVATVFHR